MKVQSAIYITRTQWQRTCACHTSCISRTWLFGAFFSAKNVTYTRVHTVWVFHYWRNVFAGWIKWLCWPLLVGFGPQAGMCVVHSGTFRCSAIFWNIYFESRISHPIPEWLVESKMCWSCSFWMTMFHLLILLDKIPGQYFSSWI